MAIEEYVGKKSVWVELLQWVQAIVFAIIIAVLIRTFVFEPVLVQGSSMEDTLYTNERLILYKLGYQIGEPERGDIIVLKYREGKMILFPFLQKLGILNNNGIDQEIDYIKRVIAVPGDTIDIRDGKVYVNGEVLDESYIKGNTMPKGARLPATIEEGYYFVMGDNRPHSSDSRLIGLIEQDRIKGKAVFRYWPFNRISSIY